MQLSVVIVNYNVRWFLTQCLSSVKKAIQGIEAEVFIVDNASTDKSVEYLKPDFPDFIFIENKENVGFSKANNQAIQMAKGKYILLLNPDTVVAEDSFHICLKFMDGKPEAGGLGVHMVDGKGIFLPESKRGLPTPFVAFCKAFGLSKLFPKSELFNRYHLGFLQENRTAEVDVLSGAFMWMRKETLDKSGLLDETFFMYGEDVDLSYRIQKAGYKNFYLPETSIIHYKGESTKKGSLNYVKVFYGAMGIFAQKHFSSSQSGLYSLLIKFAIVIRALMTLISSVLNSWFLFILDFVLALSGLIYITHYWAGHIKYVENYYPEIFITTVLPTYIIIWIFSSFIFGAYEKPYRFSPLFKGILAGTFFISAFYGLLPEHWRFSRAIILLGAAWTGIEMFFSRWFHAAVNKQSFFNEEKSKMQALFIGNESAIESVIKLEQKLYNKLDICGFISNESSTHPLYISNLTHYKEVVEKTEIDVVVFDSSFLKYKEIIQLMGSGSKRLKYKIYHPSKSYFIGSDSKDGIGEYITQDVSLNINKPIYKRQKRILDLLLIPVFLLFFLWIVIRSKQHLFSEIFNVLKGTKTWVGGTPNIPAVINPFKTEIFAEEKQRYFYYKNYNVKKDIVLLLKYLLN